MATGDIIPDGDNFVQLVEVPAGGTHESKIDEAKASPDINDYITGSNAAGHNGLVDDFHMTTLTVNTVTQIQVYAYGGSAPTYGGDFSVDLYNGSGLEGYLALGFTVPTPSWRSRTFTGLSMSQTNLNNCRVIFRIDVPSTKQVAIIYTVYAIVTYALIYAIGSPLGVIPANIGNVMGVLKANIASIKGV